MRCVFHAIAPTSSFRRVTRAERQKFVTVILILFFSCGKLGGKGGGKLGEGVEDADDLRLNWEGGRGWDTVSFATNGANMTK